MGLFFEPRAKTARLQQTLEQALRRPAGQVQNPTAEAERMAKEIAAQPKGLQPKPGSFLIATLIVCILAGAALWAEAHSMTTATDQLWTAFQTVLGVILGFLAGEASGAGSN